MIYFRRNHDTIQVLWDTIMSNLWYFSVMTLEMYHIFFKTVILFMRSYDPITDDIWYYSEYNMIYFSHACDTVQVLVTFLVILFSMFYDLRHYEVWYCSVSAFLIHIFMWYYSIVSVILIRLYYDINQTLLWY